MKFWVKTFGWMMVSACMIFCGQRFAGSAWYPALVATLGAILLKTPVYVVYEWGFHRIWPNDDPQAEPLEHLDRQLLSQED